MTIAQELREPHQIDHILLRIGFIARHIDSLVALLLLLFIFVVYLSHNINPHLFHHSFQTHRHISMHLFPILP